MAEPTRDGAAGDVPLLDLDVPAPSPATRNGRRPAALALAAVAFAAGAAAAEFVDHEATRARDALSVSIVVLPSGPWFYQDPYPAGSAPTRRVVPEHFEGVLTVQLVNSGPRPLVLTALEASGPGYEILAIHREIPLPPQGSIGVPATFTLRCAAPPFPTEVTLTIRVRTQDGVERRVERVLTVGTEPAAAVIAECRGDDSAPA